MVDHLAVLGAPDPEMEMIENLFRSAGLQVAYAAVDGQRCHPGNAYAANGWIDPQTGEFRDAAHGVQMLIVECAVALRAEHAPTPIVIDHHRPGDPGYGKGPVDYWDASSIGQAFGVLAGLDRRRPGGAPIVGFWSKYTTPLMLRDCAHGPRLQWHGPSDAGAVYYTTRHGDRAFAHYMLDSNHMLCAAADHCLAAAYRGECPGVNPDDLMAWRIKSRSEFKRRSCRCCNGSGAIEQDGSPIDCPECSESALLRKVEAARQILRDAVCSGPRRDLADLRTEVVHPDMLGMDADPTVKGHDRVVIDRRQPIPELPEAACREGIPVLVTITDRDGREKTILQAATPFLVSRFLAGELVSGLTDIYGDPARGFAGGYKS